LSWHDLQEMLSVLFWTDKGYLLRSEYMRFANGLGGAENGGAALVAVM
jgi:hypothetical protein